MSAPQDPTRTTALDPDQRDRLRRAKLTAVARDRLGLEGDAIGVGTLAALRASDTAVVLVEQGGAGALAGALVWARRHGADRLVLLVEEGAAQLARLAGHFTLGAGPIDVQALVGDRIEVAEPEPLASPAAPPEDAERLVHELLAAGVEVVVEHGVVRGEVLGLEVARLVRWPVETGGDGELHLEVGVGRFDRDATAAARPDEGPAEGLRRAVRMVSERRHTGAPAHPIQMLARARWLRSTLLADPGRVGATSLRAVEMTVEAGGLKDAHPAAAVGVDQQGGELVVVCSTGADLALVPLAADARQLHSPGARLVLAVPERDLHPVTRALVGLLREPAELVGVEPEWG